MNPKLFLPSFILSILFYSCANNTTSENKNSVPVSYRGVRIINSLPTGSIYIDSSGEKFGYRSVVIELINDTTIPVLLQISLPVEFNPLPGPADWRYKVFLLPDSIDKQYEENDSLSKDLNSYIENQSDIISNLSTNINAGEKYKITLGCLANPDGFTRIEVFSNGHKHNLSIPDTVAGAINKGSEKELNLMLGITLNESYSVIPFGKILFRE